MCDLKRSGTFTEKPDFVNAIGLSVEIVCLVSFEIVVIFIRCSCHALSVKVQLNHRYTFSNVIGDRL